jgi:hypothetical protein
MIVLIKTLIPKNKNILESYAEIPLTEENENDK